VEPGFWRGCAQPGIVRGLKLLAQAGLVLETANPNGELIAAVVEVANRAPDLRILIDHLPDAPLPKLSQERAVYDANLRELASRPQVFIKGSEIVRRINGRVPLNLSTYKDALDQIWDLFGDDRILFGSDWPNSDIVASYQQVFRLAESYIDMRTMSAQQKYFWANSQKVYRWRPRTPEQRGLRQG
jgi:L-fuconolactonase